MKAQGFTKETIAHLGKQDRDFPQFAIGDAVVVSVRIKEGNKERIQLFEGDVIAMHNCGASSTFTVRKIGSHGVPIERIFPVHSPVVEKIKVLRHGKVRRAKLYYMRDRIGKAAHVEEKIVSSQAVQVEGLKKKTPKSSEPDPEVSMTTASESKKEMTL